MAVIFNVAKGRFVELHERVNNGDPSTARLVVVLLKTAASEATLRDQETLAAVLAGGSVECDFTAYARKVLTAADLGGSTVNHTTDRRSVDLPDVTWSPAGAASGGTNNSVVKILVCYDPDVTAGVNDARLIPIMASDFIVPTNGGPITAETGADGYAYAG